MKTRIRFRLDDLSSHSNPLGGKEIAGPMEGKLRTASVPAGSLVFACVSQHEPACLARVNEPASLLAPAPAVLHLLQAGFRPCIESLPWVPSKGGTRVRRTNTRPIDGRLLAFLSFTVDLLSQMSHIPLPVLGTRPSCWTRFIQFRVPYGLCNLCRPTFPSLVLETPTKPGRTRRLLFEPGAGGSTDFPQGPAGAASAAAGPWRGLPLAWPPSPCPLHRLKAVFVTILALVRWLHRAQKSMGKFSGRSV